MQDSGSQESGVINLYAVLDLPVPTRSPQRPPTTQEIRAAYRRALLKYHPDKLPKEDRNFALDYKALERRHSAATSTVWTVDQITHAYQVLGNTELRRQYDAQLLQSWSLQTKSAEVRTQTTELDIVDLDDMEYRDDVQLWTRTCRCGNAEGFCVTEDVLVASDVAGSGEVMVGCKDCSHHVRVLYHIEVED